jgi:hypothetical protein
VKGSRESRAKRANRKWQPNSGKRKHAQLNFDLNDRITDAQIKAFFGPMSLNSPEFSSMTGKTIRQIPRAAQHAWATVCAAAAKRVLSDLGNEDYAMLFMSLPRLCLQFPSREKQKAGISTASQVLERISAVLGGDFRSFEMEQDDRPRGPQGAAGVIDESVARRIKECVRQDCISQALKAVESNGMMMGTPEVAEKLQQMCPSPADGFDYDFSEELKAEFPADEVLGAAVCYSETNGNLAYECKKEHRKYLKAALKSGKMKACDRSGIRNEHIIVALQHDK